jgi:hypothetical protein
VISGNKTISSAVLGVLATLAAAGAGRTGEDSIQEIWLAAERACHADISFASEDDLAIPASMQWSRDPWQRNCE